MFICLFLDAKVGKNSIIRKKIEEKYSFLLFFHGFVFSIQNKCVPLHRFFSKHIENRVMVN